MPKKGEAPKKILLGRSTNNLKMGIVGLPNVGKSSLFNILSKLQVAAENFPFCTIDPNVAKINVPDKRFNYLVGLYKPKSVVPAQLSVTDIAGLVRGAAEGAGLGNAFLSHISAVDGIFHVCRAFDSKKVTHVEESVDPTRDLLIIHDELRLKDIEAVKKYVEANAKNVARGIGGKEKKFEFEVMQKVLEHLEAGKDVRSGVWDAKEVEIINNQYFLTAKPMVYLANVSTKSFIAKGNKYLEKIAEFIKNRGNNDILIPFSVTFEEALIEAEANGGAEGKKKFLQEAGKGMRSMIPKIIKVGYDALNLMYFFTAGADEVRAWSVRRGTLAPKAAGVIHTDFEKGFIMAEVMKFEDLQELGSEAEVKAAGKMLQKGKNYEFEDGIIVHFKFNN
uniref:Obg-like ATPase 1 n=1 Tax=Aplanochytrium stocchinoi TaxID=215587 RepID=A0A7S3PRC8_9STRA|mmetsp:Transcript_18253/g.22514  ORF Transcript_18253/g.22514 Transcript_18253/m.22514 type:complete len:392 (+) Transcript_18253:257-1432(+)|eukprot:CAMPEP_0204837204 /NCGR_PEP_ID=MMETSP1346-20131115/27289_1 /ASSEMBLY_ACC=CAM_ASM_000771 /TAXON_ID=215587 /ORGANISM="Aplanochytrium stocchinoi, Strain GSBS06" /LENGTH=391 /DNA_ID=CAMNT_0051972499 /DNA_START=193 /DNA_END=1368 /DNA_ORIENTATION=+